MASIRNLKKDIDYLTSDIISDSFLAIGLHGEKVQDRVNNVLEKIVDLHNNLYERINQSPTGKKSKEKKTYFNSIRNDIDKKYRDLYEELSKIITEGEK